MSSSNALDTLVDWTNARLAGLDAVAPEWLAWFATLALHSSLLLLATLALTRWCRRARTRELLWRTAFVLPIVTTSLAAWSATGSFTWTVEAASLDAFAASSEGVSPTTFDLPGMTAGVARAELAMPSARTWALLGVFLATAIGLARFALQRMRLTLWLTRRARVAGDDPRQLQERVQRLARAIGLRRRVRVTQHEKLTTPIAFGVLIPEVCVPTRPLAALGDAELDAALAHEIAHLTCRDPLAFTLQNLISKLFWWQPLFGVAHRRLEELAEYRCDAMAAEVSGRKAVASCLVELATWVRNTQRLAHVPSMAGRPSALRKRVERVLDSEEPARFGRFGIALLAFCLSAGSASSLAMPNVKLDARDAEIVDADGEILLMPESKRLFAALVELDLEYSKLAGDFASLQRDLLSRAVSGRTLRALQAIGQQLNALDARRIELRSRVLEALAVEATRLGTRQD